MRFRTVLASLACIGLMSAPAIAGEVNGSKKNPKEDFSEGASICKFSGLNDVPEGDPEQGPPGRTQSFGQDVAKWGADPRDFNPGDICNPNILNVKDW